MKKTTRKMAAFFGILFGLVCFFGAPELRADKVMFSFSAGFLFPADSNYKEIYGQQVLGPEFKLGLRIVNDFYVYGSFFNFNKNGRTPVLEEATSSKQQFIGGGLAYFPYLNRSWKLFIGAGVGSLSYKEEAMDLTVNGSKLGFLLEGGIYFKEKFMFIGLNAGYCSASDTYEEVKFKIGGAR
ncbi:MAG: hypothetical protein RBR88_00910, partial [Candidatus Saccharicenans sp.]|nr:hypothetical protein [Candidatus Saccharicenans sp.]